MAGVRLKIEFDRTIVSSALQRAMEVLGDVRPLMADIGEQLLISHRERFASQESPTGNTWELLSPRYRATKKKNQNRILTLEGLLGGTLRYSPSSDGLLFGTDRKYGAAHQFGIPERGLPARPWLGVSDSDAEEIVAITQDHLNAALKG